MNNGHIKTDALVLREVKYKEADRILSLYSSEYGRITAKAPGALRKNSKFGAGTQMLTYSDFVLFGNNGKFNVTEATIIEEFKGLRSNIESFALGCYFAECVESLTEEDNPDRQVLQLILNSLFALSRELYDPYKIKAAFELRFMCLLGYEPDLNSCFVCKNQEVKFPVLGYESGHICCRDCCSSELGAFDYLCSNSLEAMRYITSCNAKNLFSFNITEDAEKRMSVACEHFFLSHAERTYGTLDYWKKIKL